MNRPNPNTNASTVNNTIQGILSKSTAVIVMEKFHLIHETSCINVQRILLSRYLFTSGKTQNMRHVVGGQGGSNRKLARDPRVSLHESNFMEKYDEVDGVYFRLHPKLHHMTDTYSDCVMVFSHKMLQDFDFVLTS